jgi:hypothetical protein
MDSIRGDALKKKPTPPEKEKEANYLLPYRPQPPAPDPHPLLPERVTLPALLPRAPRSTCAAAPAPYRRHRAPRSTGTAAPAPYRRRRAPRHRAPRPTRLPAAGRPSPSCSPRHHREAAPLLLHAPPLGA